MSSKTKFWLKVSFFVYALLLLSIVQYVSVTHNGGEVLFKQRWVIIGLFVGLVEVLNQFSYNLGKYYARTVLTARLIVFWLIFTVAVGWYLYLLGGLKEEIAFIWREKVLDFVVIFLLSCYLPFYSFALNVRFICLYGKLGKNQDS